MDPKSLQTPRLRLFIVTSWKVSDAKCSESPIHGLASGCSHTHQHLCDEATPSRGAHAQAKTLGQQKRLRKGAPGSCLVGADFWDLLRSQAFSCGRWATTVRPTCCFGNFSLEPQGRRNTRDGVPRDDIRFRLSINFIITLIGLVLSVMAWPGLSKMLLAYGYLSRIPVAILQYLAMRGHWGTHYDALDPGFPLIGFWPTFLRVSFVPNIFFMEIYTVVVGTLVGIAAVAVLGRVRPDPLNVQA